jgi:hypothetical protein
MHILNGGNLTLGLLIWDHWNWTLNWKKKLKLRNSDCEFYSMANFLCLYTCLHTGKAYWHLSKCAPTW